jgi:hypothetical protein
MARKVLRQLQAEQPDISVDEVDILAAPRRAWQDGVRMIPAIRIDDQLLSSILLDRAAISAFIAKARQD